MSEQVIFTNIESIEDATMHYENNNNKVLITVIDSVGRTNVLSLHPHLVDVMKQLTFEAIVKTIQEDGN